MLSIGLCAFAFVAAFAAGRRSLVAGLVRGWLEPAAVVVCEYELGRARDLPTWPPELELERRRRYGQTGVDFLRAPAS